ncbi:hypothetical protein BT96DRAFT_929212, partial [Gymnopus androsaceus JB14]
MMILPIYNFSRIPSILHVIVGAITRYSLAKLQCRNPHVRHYQKKGNYEDNMALRVHTH